MTCKCGHKRKRHFADAECVVLTDKKNRLFCECTEYRKLKK